MADKNNVCNICDNEIGLKWCSCEFKMCSCCVEELDKYECGQCRKSLKKSIYFAGKIVYHKKVSLDHEKVSLTTRILVLKTEDKADTYDTLSNNKHIDCMPEMNEFITLAEFSNIKKELPIIEFPKYKLTGPCIIVDPDILVGTHGCFSLSLVDLTNCVSLLNKRNSEMIKKCDIFVLSLNDKVDCFCHICISELAMLCIILVSQ
jgi:hypothetical protein